MHDRAHVVAADGGADALFREGAHVDVLPGERVRLVGVSASSDRGVAVPVGWVECYSVDFDQDVVVSELRQWNLLEFSLASLNQLQGLHGLGEISHVGQQRNEVYSLYPVYVYNKEVSSRKGEFIR